MRYLLALAIAVAAAHPASADPIGEALAVELQRSMDELVLPDAEPPYFMAYSLYDTRSAYAEASFGSLIRSGEARRRPLRAEVRVGSFAVDNSNFSAFGDDPSGVTGASLVLDDDPVAIRRDLWIVTDDAYKSAVEGLSRKNASREQVPDEERSADFSAVESLQHTALGGAVSPDVERMEVLARDLSAPARDHPRVEFSRTYASDLHWIRYLVNSEGTRIVDDGRSTVVRVVFEARADDGALVKDTCSWLSRGADQLPAVDEMRAEVKQTLERLDAIATAPEVEDYLGPVIFEGQAAAELFRQLLVPQLMGTPPEETDNAWGTDDGRPLARIGRRVLPAGFLVWDDPASASPDRAGAYLHDHEGVPATQVELVRDGVVRSLLMSRTPREDLEHSNGHGRGGTDSRIVGMPGVLFAEQRGGPSGHKLLAQAFRMARQSGLDHVLVVRVLDDPAMRTASSIRRIRFGGSDGPSLTAPLEVVRLYRDGREQPVRSARFFASDHRVLRDVVGATGNICYEYLAPPVLHGGTSWVAGPTSGVPVTLQVPRTVLVSEMEIGPRTKGRTPPPLLDSPLAE